ncbi:hypothetical protein BJY04DRAFT_219836 [Aspergillus karnatakaensis]|uniref:uncharacterized protein n=1 Tax=Aspergillus karnatakaensis TaxID=1810916 RepID=UPI003CCD031E
MSITDTIPLYLCDRVPLQDTLDSATQCSKNELLLGVLRESKSLPRETDTYPNSPRPDHPSAAQEKLLDLVREVSGQRWGSLKGKDRDSGVGLDELDDGPGVAEEEAGEEYALLKETIQASFPRAFADNIPEPNPDDSIFADRYESASTPEQEPVTSRTNLLHPLSGSGSKVSSNQKSKPIPRSKTHHRRTSSHAKQGEAKQFYNLVSFLAFLTKEKLLLHPGVGERIAIEMIHDTLPQSSPSERSQDQSTHKPWFGCSDETSITAISLFLIIMGEELCQRTLATQRSGSTIEKDRNGALAKLVSQNWETWRTRLQFLSLREDLGIAAREQAAEAAAVMGRV